MRHEGICIAPAPCICGGIHESYSDTPWEIEWTVSHRRNPINSIHTAAICAGDRGSSGRSVRREKLYQIRSKILLAERD